MSLAWELAKVQATVRGRCSPEQMRLLDHGVHWLRTSGALGAAVRRGELVPDFDLPDVHGRQVSLAHLLDRGPVVVTFFCGSWCPLCATTLGAYQRMFSCGVKDGGTLVAITLEGPQGVATLSVQAVEGIHVMSDRGGRVSRLYGLVYALPPALVHLHRDLGIDLPERNISRRWELPVAATYVVNGEGVAVFAFVDADHGRRAEPDELLAVLAQLPSNSVAAKISK
jgi:peroxiredoxin